MRPISRTNYIHNNKGNITIGIKGQVKTVFLKSDLSQALSTIQGQGRELSKAYTKNSKFPSTLGLSDEPSELIAPAESLIVDIIQTGKTQETPQEARAALNDLIMTAHDKDLFEQKFYGKVNEYYGTNYSVTKTKQELERGTFRAPKGDIKAAQERRKAGRKPLQDYERYKDWIINQSDKISVGKIRSMTSAAELDYVTQIMEQDGYIPEEIRDMRYKDDIITIKHKDD
jgi:hypothetical protein